MHTWSNDCHTFSMIYLNYFKGLEVTHCSGWLIHQFRPSNPNWSFPLISFMQQPCSRSSSSSSWTCFRVIRWRSGCAGLPRRNSSAWSTQRRDATAACPSTFLPNTTAFSHQLDSPAWVHATLVRVRMEASASWRRPETATTASVRPGSLVSTVRLVSFLTFKSLFSIIWIECCRKMQNRLL